MCTVAQQTAGCGIQMKLLLRLKIVRINVVNGNNCGQCRSLVSYNYQPLQNQTKHVIVGYNHAV